MDALTFVAIIVVAIIFLIGFVVYLAFKSDVKKADPTPPPNPWETLFKGGRR